MESHINYTVVGVFVVVLVSAFIAGILWLSSGIGGRQYNDYVTHVAESVSGLNVNAPVKYRGVDVGFVREIGLRPQDPEEVRLLMAIETGTPVKEDTIAVLSVQGLTGIAFIDLTGGTAAARMLEARPGEAHPEIEAGPSLLARLDSAASQMFTNIERVSDAVSAFLDEENQAAFKEAIDGIRDVALRLERALDEDRAQDIGETLEALHEISTTFARNADEIDRLAANLGEAGERLPGAVARLDTMATSMDRAGDQLTVTMRDAQVELGHLSQQLGPEAVNTLTELRELSMRLDRFVQELERDPAILVHGRRELHRGPGERP